LRCFDRGERDHKAVQLPLGRIRITFCQMMLSSGRVGGFGWRRAIAVVQRPDTDGVGRRVSFGLKCRRKGGNAEPKRNRAHEAGHAAAAFFQDLPFIGVHIVADLDTGRLGMLEQDPVTFQAYRDDDHSLRDLERRIIKALAGIVAEARHTGRLQWRYGVEDLNAAFGLAMQPHWRKEGSPRSWVETCRSDAAPS
jgi:hypothetical protein